MRWFKSNIPSKISIHASAKEATGLIPSVVNPIFQSTPPRRRRHLYLRQYHQENKFQSTPPRRRRRSPVHQKDRWLSISIHASAKEATLSTNILFVLPLISIHASAKEATPLKLIASCASLISIHASAKEATKAIKRGAANCNISIHASAKEATPRRYEGRKGNKYFNPRLREGGDEVL